jgi:hypothetical protein
VNCAKRKLDRRSTFVAGDIVDVTEGVTREDSFYERGRNPKANCVVCFNLVVKLVRAIFVKIALKLLRCHLFRD